MYSGPEANGPVGGIGMGPVNSTCGFTAQTPGGYSGQGQWQLRVTRRGQTTTYTSGVSPACGVTHTIEPGDEVEATTSVGGGATQGTTGYGATAQESYIGAGHGFGC
ncbi:MAG: hypothetical protein NVSMB12_14010 [Acidimicrobiales bacterium]